METKKHSLSPRIPVSRGGSGLWMRMDSDPLMDLTGGRGQKPRDVTTGPPPGPAVISRYYSVMDDEDNSVPPPPPDEAPSLHTVPQVNNSNVTFTKGSADAVEAEDNPSGLGWDPRESRLMATQSAAEEVIVNTEQTSTDAVSVPPEDQDLTSMEEACCDPTRRRHCDGTSGGEPSQPKSIAILSEGQKRCREAEAQSNKNPRQVPSNIEENSEITTHFDKEGESMCGFADTYSKLTVKSADFGDVKSGEDIESYEPPERSKRDQNRMDVATCRLYAPDVPVEESSGEAQASRHSISDGSEETGQGDGSRRISNGIQQGEQLLQRLQLVQLRQDVCLPRSPHASQQAVPETRGGTKSAPGTDVDDSQARGALLTVGNEEEESGGARWKPMAMEESERYAVEAEAGMSLVMPTMQSEQRQTTRAEAGDSEEDQRDSWAPADRDETSATQIPFLSTCHRLSAANSCVEGRSPQEAQGSLQRAAGIFDFADDPDVLEIPFKNNISLEPFPTEDGDAWQFTSQKMKKEISQETQRELVLVNQGKIPGGYSKGGVRQLKETKLLFEAFQQDNAIGPARPQKPTVKGHVYPSVLERTRSLEMLSFKSRPVSRTHSFRLIKESEKHAEILRPVGLTSGSPDKTGPSHSVKHKEHLSGSADSVDAPREAKGPQECPVVRGNPFFKLRPALALKPEVEKDIREAKERDEELRRQRCTLYGENRPRGEDGEGSKVKPTHATDVRKQSRGKLERVWPPPSKKDQKKSEQTQEAKVHRAGGQRASLWQRWESGLINGKTANEKN